MTALEQRPRLAWPDLAKGVGILLMAVGHSAIPPAWVGTWLYSFHMPLFFLLSGWFFSLRPGSVSATIRHKAFSILMPMVSYGTARWLCTAVSALFHGGAPDVRPLLGVLLQWPGTPYAGFVWFFPALFVAESVFALLLKCVQARPKVLLGVSFLLAGLSYGASLLGAPRLPWHAGAALLLLPYLALGWFARRHEAALFARADRHFLPAALVLLALNAGLTALNARLGSGHIDYNLRILHEFVTAYAAGVCGVFLCVLLCRRLPPFPPLAFLGNYSAVYYAVGWLGSTVAHDLVRSFWPVSGLPLLIVHLLGLWLLPIPLILCLRRFCPALMGKRK